MYYVFPKSTFATYYIPHITTSEDYLCRHRKKKKNLNLKGSTLLPSNEFPFETRRRVPLRRKCSQRAAATSKRRTGMNSNIMRHKDCLNYRSAVTFVHLLPLSCTQHYVAPPVDKCNSTYL